MRRLHCATCTCADAWTRDAVDTRAPFYGLVIEIDRIVLAEQRDRFERSLAERRAASGDPRGMLDTATERGVT